MRVTSRVLTFFKSNDEKFAKACDRLKIDSIYQPNLTKEELENLAKINPNIKILQPSKIKAINHGEIYDLYIIKDHRINDKFVILVDLEGKYSFHKKADAKIQNFNNPLKFKIEDFLNPLDAWKHIFLSDPDHSCGEELKIGLRPLKYISFVSSHSINHLEGDNAISDPGSPNKKRGQA